jgi:hypothetical protein
MMKAAGDCGKHIAAYNWSHEAYILERQWHPRIA